MNNDLPTITDASHAHSTYSLSNMANPVLYAGTTGVGLSGAPLQALNVQNMQTTTPLPRRLIVGNEVHNAQVAAAFQDTAMPAKPKKEPKVTRRLVQVFIADPDDNVPLDDSLLYSGQQKLTDATDQELFFEVDMKTILAIHNEKRAKLVNKKVKERTEYLEPAKIRDLRMVVVNVATF